MPTAAFRQDLSAERFDRLATGSGNVSIVSGADYRGHHNLIVELFKYELLDSANSRLSVQATETTVTNALLTLPGKPLR